MSEAVQARALMRSIIGRIATGPELSKDISREAAAMDGARWFTVLRRVELPQMMGTILIAAFIRFIDGFRVFDNIWVERLWRSVMWPSSPARKEPIGASTIRLRSSSGPMRPGESRVW